MIEKSVKRLLYQQDFVYQVKTAVFFCPNMRKHEILALSYEEKERVRFIEANAKNKVELNGLGRNYSWTDLIRWRVNILL